MCWERVAAFPTMETSLLERVVQRRELGGHFHPVWLRCLIYLRQPRKLPLSQSAMSCKKAGCRERGLGSGIGRDSIRSRAITLAAPSLHPCLHFNLAASYTINHKRFFAQPCGDSIWSGVKYSIVWLSYDLRFFHKEVTLWFWGGVGRCIPLKSGIIGALHFSGKKLCRKSA